MNVKRIIVIFCISCFFIVGCAMPNPYIKVNTKEKIEFNKNEKIPIHVFATHQEKKGKNNEAYIFFEKDVKGLYYLCSKNLVSESKILTIFLKIFVGVATLGAIFLVEDGTEIENKNNIVLKYSLDDKIEVIDESNNYKTKEEFINEFNKKQNTFFITIDFYDVKNVSIRKDESASFCYIYKLNVFVGAFDVYKSYKKSPKNLYHYQELFIPERLERTSDSTSIFEPSSLVAEKMIRELMKNLNKFFNGDSLEKKEIEKENNKKTTSEEKEILETT